jgi:putative ATPase
MSTLYKNLFSNIIDLSKIPLAERVRPRKINDIVGQTHLIGENKILNNFLKLKNLPSIIFWGPPGVGKTTIANVLALELGYKFTSLSAVDSGVKDLRNIIQEAESRFKNNQQTILFIDEIHRFNKSQQDALLHAVEKGILILIGATTENPSFEVNSALLSRCRIYKLNPLDKSEILELIDKTIKNDEVINKYKIEFEDKQLFAELSSGDARKALNLLESAFYINKKENSNEIFITNKSIEEILTQNLLLYDKKGENHYDTISAFIKSMRGSDPNASILWLAKMIAAGEDPKFIARRMIIFASEDIGNADPNALQIAISVFKAVEIIGLPECAINLAQGVTYLASAPKSNASYLALLSANEEIEKGISTVVPLKLRNAPTIYMKSEGYSKDYKYPHEYPLGFVEENYFPDNIEPITFYKPKEIGYENIIKSWLKKLWKNY